MFDFNDLDFLDDKNGIEYIWMCKKVNEEFLVIILLLGENGGCWENGIYVFGGDNEIVLVFMGDFY